jgi:hypothetical protein
VLSRIRDSLSAMSPPMPLMLLSSANLDVVGGKEAKLAPTLAYPPALIHLIGENGMDKNNNKGQIKSRPTLVTPTEIDEKAMKTNKERKK